MLRGRSIVTAGICCLLCAVSVHAQDPRDRLAAFVRDVITVDAGFTQTLSDADGLLMEEARGQFQLNRPGRFRWNYTEPYKREVVSDGERVWIYDPELEQVTVREIGDSLGTTPAGLLAGSETALNDLEITRLNREGPLEWIQVVPEGGGAEFSSVVLGFEASSLVELEFVDRLDQRTRIVFSDLILNEPVPEEQFIFSAPSGADIIGPVPMEDRP